MKKRITRLYNHVIAEVYIEKNGKEHLVCTKTFDRLFGLLEPTENQYTEANKWCDDVIILHLKNTQ